MFPGMWRNRSDQHHRFILLIVGCASLACPVAYGFSLGVRPFAGVEMLNLTGVKLIRLDDLTQVTADGNVKRNPMAFGLDLAVTPLEFGNLSISTSVGYRMTSTSTKGPDAYNDDISFSYIPIGLSFDFSVKSFRTSGFFSYDLGMSPKIKLSVDKTGSSLDVKVAGLSRMRFGGRGEFFITPSFSLFGQGDYAMGQYKTDTGPLDLADQEGNRLPAVLAPSESKLSGLTFGGGVAYYIMPPASQQKVTASPSKGSKGKATPGKKPAKPGAKRTKPKPKVQE